MNCRNLLLLQTKTMTWVQAQSFQIIVFADVIVEAAADSCAFVQVESEIITMFVCYLFIFYVLIKIPILLQFYLNFHIP